MTDALSELLAVAGVRGALISRARLGPPFGVTSGAQPRAIFHAVRAGACVLRVGAGAPVCLRRGDMAVLPRGASHDIADTPSSRCVRIGLFDVVQEPGQLPTLTNDRAPSLDLLCGTFVLGAPAHEWLIDPLPEVLVLRGEHRVAGFVAATLELMEAELAEQALGSWLVSNRLVEILVVHLLRSWATDHADGAGWLSAFTDPQLGRVLSLVHLEPAAPWDLDRMARAAGLSRTRFAARFRSRVGLAPGEFVTTWRIAVAKRALREGAGVAQAAAQVGYSSEASFSRAFKRLIGQSPGAWRAAL